MPNRKKRARVKYTPDAEVLAMLQGDIAAIFGDVSEMLWPHEVAAVQRWLSDERKLWGYGRDEPPCGTSEAFAVVRGWLLGQYAKTRAYQRRQLALPILQDFTNP